MFSFFGNYLEPFSYVIYLIAVWIYFKSTTKRKGKVLGFYYVLASGLMLTASLLVEHGGNIWVYNLNAFVTIIFLGYYFYLALESRSKKYTVILLTLLCVIYSIIKNNVLQELAFFDSVGYSLVSAFVAINVFMYLHQLLKNVSEKNILHHFTFWLSCSYLLYFLGSFIIFVSYYYLTKKIIDTYTDEERELLTALWGVHNVLLFLSGLSLLIGSIWLTYRKKLI